MALVVRPGSAAGAGAIHAIDIQVRVALLVSQAVPGPRHRRPSHGLAVDTQRLKCARQGQTPQAVVLQTLLGGKYQASAIGLPSEVLERLVVAGGFARAALGGPVTIDVLQDDGPAVRVTCADE